MGSSCSILNDTKHDVWITHGINWAVLLGMTFGLLMVFIGLVALAILAAAEAGTVSDLSVEDWSRIETVLSKADEELAKVLNITESEAAKMKSAIKAEFQENAELIKPGAEKYTWSGTLSLTMRVYVMNDKLQCDDRGCFTGPTAGSENVYTISEYFKKLDVD